ncbi:hypothetical protein Dimus_025058 [Dionaea muscipula]
MSDYLQLLHHIHMVHMGKITFFSKDDNFTDRVSESLYVNLLLLVTMQPNKNLWISYVAHFTGLCFFFCILYMESTGAFFFILSGLFEPGKWNWLKNLFSFFRT